MKKRLFLLTSLFLFAFPVIALAQEAIAAESSDWKTALISAIVPTAIAAVSAILGWLGTLLGKFVDKKIKDVDNDALQKAAYVAVRYVNDYMKKATGGEKFKAACERVAKKLPKVDGDDVEEAVRAMYTNFSSEISKNV